MKYINILLVTLIACVAAFSSQAQRTGEFMTVAAPVIPESINFCGDHVSFDRIDMAERLDREMTAVIYGQTTTSLIIKRANRYFPRLIEILKENNMPEDLIYLAVAESSLDINALSPAKAAGIWQFMAATGKQYGLEVNDDVDERYDPEKETVAACRYLRDAYSRYHNWATVCASYNAGTGRITNELSSQQVSNSFDLRLVSETSRYVVRIIAYKIFLENPKKYGYRIYSNQLYQPIDCEVIEVSQPISNWVTWAKEHGISYMQLRDVNPWIRSTKLPNASGKVYKVKVPKHDSLYRSKAGNRVYNRNWVVD